MWVSYRDSIQTLLDDSCIVLLDCNETAFVMRAKVHRLRQTFMGVPFNYQRVGRNVKTADWGGGGGRSGFGALGHIL
jgi:hypothetical protein